MPHNYFILPLLISLSGAFDNTKLRGFCKNVFNFLLPNTGINPEIKLSVGL